MVENLHKLVCTPTLKAFCLLNIFSFSRWLNWNINLFMMIQASRICINCIVLHTFPWIIQWIFLSIESSWCRETATNIVFNKIGITLSTSLEGRVFIYFDLDYTIVDIACDYEQLWEPREVGNYSTSALINSRILFVNSILGLNARNSINRKRNNRESLNCKFSYCEMSVC